LKNKVLISAKELIGFSSAETFAIIDTREQAEYVKGHIPGAVNIHRIFTYLATEDNGGLETLSQTFVKEFSAAGISNKDFIVIYEDTFNNGYGQSCRGYFILKYMGHENVSILHGGFAAWQQEGYEITVEIPVKPKTEFKPNINNNIVVTKEQMKEAIEKKEVVILDCRDKDEWTGENSSPYGKDFCPRKGRIPGAVWLEWHLLMNNNSGIPLFRSNEEILEQCQQVGITPQSEVIVYCFKGSRASNTIVALQQAGIKNVKNYFASWNEWSRDFSLPIDNSILHLN